MHSEPEYVLLMCSPVLLICCFCGPVQSWPSARRYIALCILGSFTMYGAFTHASGILCRYFFYSVPFRPDAWGRFICKKAKNPYRRGTTYNHTHTLTRPCTRTCTDRCICILYEGPCNPCLDTWFGYVLFSHWFIDYFCPASIWINRLTVSSNTSFQCDVYSFKMYAICDATFCWQLNYFCRWKVIGDDIIIYA